MADATSATIETTQATRRSALLATKLYLPRPRPDLVPRTRLLALLDGARSRKLTLVSAPSGFGKTTVLCEWLRQRQPPAAWISLDEGDNDLVRFWAYMVAAFGQLQPGVGQASLDQLQLQDPRLGHSALTPLLNDLAAVPSELTLVLDDYHTIQSQPVHASLSFFLEHLPEHVHVILATRADPPLPVARLRARGQVVELRAADLRFSLEETARFLHQTMGLPLSPEEVAALEARTEGWIAGLHLAALSLQGREAASDYVAAFAGNQGYLLDYLTEEVLLRQPESLQSFLLRTSILQRLNGSLCDALTGRADGQATLAELERANLFLVPLDETRRWYRYHHLFADLLRHRLQALGTPAVRELHGRASAWYEQQGLLAEAIRHALDAHDLERAARLIETAAPEAYLQSEVSTLLSWFEALPEPVVLAHPTLCVFQAALLYRLRRFEAVESRLKCVAGAELGLAARAIQMALWADLAQVAGDLARAHDCAREALALGERAVAELAGQDARFALVVTLFAACCLEEIQANRGQLREATATARRGLQLARAAILTPPWTMAVANLHVDLAGLLYEADDLDGAARHAREAIKLSQQVRHRAGELHASLMLARVRLAQGMEPDALALTTQAEQIAQQIQLPLDQSNALPRLARTWQAQGNLAVAERWLEQAEGLREASDSPHPPGVLSAWPEPIAHIRARLWLAAGRPDQAAALLRPLQAQAGASGQTRVFLEILILQALACQAQGDVQQALDTLQAALALAEPEGYVRIFVDEGAPMAALLRAALAQGKGSGLVDRLLARLPAPGAAGPIAVRPRAAPPDALSQRELEVLQLIAQGLSNQEIARKLVIAVGTVKRHVNNIFGKLGVTSRIQAVVRARERHLL